MMKISLRYTDHLIIRSEEPQNELFVTTGTHVDHELVRHPSQRSGALPEKSDPVPFVRSGPIMEGCVKYGSLLDEPSA